MLGESKPYRRHVLGSWRSNEALSTLGRPLADCHARPWYKRNMLDHPRRELATGCRLAPHKTKFLLTSPDGPCHPPSPTQVQRRTTRAVDGKEEEWQRDTPLY